MESWGWAIPTGLLALLAGFGKSYLDKRVQNLATAQDAGKIEKAIQEVRHEYESRMNSISAAISSSTAAQQRLEERRLDRTTQFVEAFASHLHAHFLIFDNARLLRMDHQQLANYMGEVQRGFAVILDSWCLMLILEKDPSRWQLTSECITHAMDLELVWRRKFAEVLTLANKKPDDWISRIEPLKELSRSVGSPGKKCLSALMEVLGSLTSEMTSDQHVRDAVASIKKVHDEYSKVFDESTEIDAADEPA